MENNKFKILFVCLGNICRSPMAECIMNDFLKKHGLDKFVITDSAGLIAYHSGENSDSRMIMHAKQHGYNLYHISRRIDEEDFYNFDMIVCMDHSNYDKLMDMAPGIDEEAKISLMTDYCQTINTDHVPDPYYGGSKGFDNVIEILEDSCNGLINHLKDILKI